MARLSISNFSCIDQADIELTRLVILIGPQASGKSIISKLTYFFYEIFPRQYQSAENGEDSKEFRDRIAADFAIWFPPEAWGNQRFNIQFQISDFSIRILRGMTKGKPGNKINVKFSVELEDQYSELCAAYKAAVESDTRHGQRDFLLGQSDALRRIRSVSERALISRMKNEYIAFQLFVPAGRSFFTSIGKAVAVFERGGVFDPITLQFGRLFANLRDSPRSFQRVTGGLHDPREERAPSDVRRQEISSELFGGEIRIERNKEYVAAHDGRKVPFSALSSGQQELLPLWILLNYFISIRLSSIQDKRSERIFIEEPEAHLFPAAQSLLVEFLVSLLSTEYGRKNLFITTHSPYVLSKINNLLLAGTLGAARSKGLGERIEKITARRNWLRIKETRVYAIADRKTQSILGKDGLIDGSYLDGISDVISNEFMQLVELEG